MAIFAAVGGAQLAARSRSDIAAYDTIVEIYQKTVSFLFETQNKVAGDREQTRIAVRRRRNPRDLKEAIVLRSCPATERFEDRRDSIQILGRRSVHSRHWHSPTARAEEFDGSNVARGADDFGRSQT